jgi:hypothetical protein
VGAGSVPSPALGVPLQPPSGATNYYYVVSDAGEAAPTGFKALPINGVNGSRSFNGSYSKSSYSFQPGDVVEFLSGGNYTGPFCLGTGGTTSNHVVVTTTSSGVANLKATAGDCSGWSATTGFLVDRSAYTDISNLSLTGTTGLYYGVQILSSNITLNNVTANSFGNTGIVADNGASEITMTNVSANQNYYLGIGFITVSNARVSGCTVTYNGDPAQAGGGLFTSDNSQNIVVEHCEVASNISGNGADGDGIDFDWSSSHMLAQYNYVHDNDGAGLMIDDAGKIHINDDITMRYNVAVNNGRANGYGDIDLNDYPTLSGRPSTAVSHWYVYGNTIYSDHRNVKSGTPSGIRINFFQDASAGKYTIVLANNLIMASNNGGAVNLLTLAGKKNNQPILSNNAMWAAQGSSAYVLSGLSDSSADFNLTAAEEQPGISGVSSSAQTVSDPDAFKIAVAASPLVGKGLGANALEVLVGGAWTLGDAPAEDYAGDAVSPSAALDIGAFSYGVN